MDLDQEIVIRIGTKNIKRSMKLSNLSSKKDNEQRSDLFSLFEQTPIEPESLMMNLGLYVSRQSLSRILFMHEIYKKILDVHGVIMEFGVRFGQSLALFQNFRGIYEPYNYTRQIIGFDTFTGFPDVHKKDGSKPFIKKGAYSVSDNYKEYLSFVLDNHEKESPISHLKKYELVEGDAITMIHEYLKRNPHTIIALAYFDFDIYEPTKKCLEAIRDRLTKGSVVGFDELCHIDFPGETEAVMEVLGLSNIRLQRCQFNPTTSYIVVE